MVKSLFLAVKSQPLSSELCSMYTWSPRLVQPLIAPTSYLQAFHIQFPTPAKGNNVEPSSDDHSPTVGPNLTLKESHSLLPALLSFR